MNLTEVYKTFTENAITFEVLLPLIQAAIAFCVILSVRNYIIKLLAWWRFKGSLDICIGTWISWEFGHKVIEGKIVHADINRVTISCKKFRISTPTKSFCEKDWVLLKREINIEEVEPVAKVSRVTKRKKKGVSK